MIRDLKSRDGIEGGKNPHPADETMVSLSSGQVSAVLSVDDSLRRAALRASVDVLFSLPLVLFKNQRQSGVVEFNAKGVRGFCGAYVTSVMAGYVLLDRGALAPVLAGVISAAGELATRPGLTGHSPTRMGTLSLGAREAAYWWGLSLADRLIRYDKGWAAAAVQTISCCGVCNFLDVVFAKSVVLNWKTPRDAVSWMRSSPGELWRLLLLSAPLRLASGVVVPVGVLSYVG